MATFLITGASGFIGRGLIEVLAPRHTIVCISRSTPSNVAGQWVRGDFASFEDLRQLNGYTIDAVIHLAAVTGGAAERDCMLVNVEGTRVLMRYLIDCGCKKFVLASSIAAVGLQRPDFRPLSVPIADDHPCFDKDGYGFSKYMMEQVAAYYARQNASLDITALRLAAVCPDEPAWPKRGLTPAAPEWALASLTVLTRSQVVDALARAAESPAQPGIRLLNAAASKAWTTISTADLLRQWWGNSVDLSHYDKPGHEYDSVFDVRAIGKALSFNI